MNYFLELELYAGEGYVMVRPEHVAAVEDRSHGEYVTVRMIGGAAYMVEPGQFVVSKLINHTGHAGMRVLK